MAVLQFSLKTPQGTDSVFTMYLCMASLLCLPSSGGRVRAWPGLKSWSVFFVPFLCSSPVGELGRSPRGSSWLLHSTPFQPPPRLRQLESTSPRGPGLEAAVDALGPPSRCPRGDGGRGEQLVSSVLESLVPSHQHHRCPWNTQGSIDPRATWWALCPHLSSFPAGSVWSSDLHLCLPQGFFKLPSISFINPFLFKPAQVDPVGCNKEP